MTATRESSLHRPTGQQRLPSSVGGDLRPPQGGPMAAAPAKSAAYGGQVRHQISQARFQDIAQDRDPLAFTHPRPRPVRAPRFPCTPGEHRAAELAAAGSRCPRVVPCGHGRTSWPPVSPQRVPAPCAAIRRGHGPTASVIRRVLPRTVHVLKRSPDRVGQAAGQEHRVAEVLRSRHRRQFGEHLGVLAGLVAEQARLRLARVNRIRVRSFERSAAEAVASATCGSTSSARNSSNLVDAIAVACIAVRTSATRSRSGSAADQRSWR